MKRFILFFLPFILSCELFTDPKIEWGDEELISSEELELIHSDPDVVLAEEEDTNFSYLGEEISEPEADSLLHEGQEPGLAKKARRSRARILRCRRYRRNFINVCHEATGKYGPHHHIIVYKIYGRTGYRESKRLVKNYRRDNSKIKMLHNLHVYADVKMDEICVSIYDDVTGRNDKYYCYTTKRFKRILRNHLRRIVSGKMAKSIASAIAGSSRSFFIPIIVINPCSFDILRKLFDCEKRSI